MIDKDKKVVGIVSRYDVLKFSHSNEVIPQLVSYLGTLNPPGSFHLGFSDDWPLWVPPERATCPSPTCGRDEAGFDKEFSYVFKAWDSIGRKYPIFFGFLEPETNATNKNNPATFIQTVYDVAAKWLFLSPKKLLFLSSQIYTGNLGGLAGADIACQNLASNAGLTAGPVGGGTGKVFKAWLSDSATSARDRLTHATVPYKLVNGTVVANNWTDLTDGTLANPILKDEAGRTVASAPPYPYVWTDTNSDGSQTSRNIGDTCQNWTVTTSSIQGGAGFSAHTALSWTQHSSQNCALTARLYCMEQ